MEPGIIRQIIERCGNKGFVTFDELNDMLPSDKTSPEDIEAILQALSESGTHLVEDP